MIDDVFAPRTAKRGLLEVTGQTTVYHIGDAGDMQKGIPKGGDGYRVLTAATDPAFPGGVFSGSVNLDVAHYAAATISFDNATSKILDSANLLATVLTGDTIVVKGSAGNDNIAFTVTTGNTAAFAIVTPAPTTEGAGAYISLYKRASHANAAVVDAATGKMWSRAISLGEKIGPSSNGLLYWYFNGFDFTLHPAAADLSIVAPSTLRIIGGAGEIARYHVGDALKLAGFATATNNLPGWVVSSVTVNGADLDIVLRILGKTAPTAEVAAGSRSIKLVTRSMFSYVAAVNASALSGYTDWRLPTISEIYTLMDLEAPNANPDGVAFPAWAGNTPFCSDTTPNNTANAGYLIFTDGSMGVINKANLSIVCLVRSV